MKDKFCFDLVAQRAQKRIKTLVKRHKGIEQGTGIKLVEANYLMDVNQQGFRQM